MNIKSVYAALVGLALLCTPVGAQVLVTLSPSPVLQFINANGSPASGGEVFIYAAGTTTKITTYIDSTGATPNTNPIILDTRGDANIWIQPGIAYKYVLAPPGSSDPPTAPIWTVDNISLGSTSVSSTTNLQTTSRSSVPTGIILRVDYAPGNGAPPMWFTSETGNCTSNGRVNDGGSCVNATDGNSWVAQFPNSQIDIREFGAIANNSTPSDTAVTADVAYARLTNTCTYVPGTPLPFSLNSSITVTGTNPVCIVGSPTVSYGGALTKNQACQLHFVNDTNGIYLDENGPGDQLRHLSLCGNASESLVATKTYGILNSHTREVLEEDIYMQDFVVDSGYLGPTARSHNIDVRVNDQLLQPNITNGFPRSCYEIQNDGNGDPAAMRTDGDECREQSFAGNPSNYTGDGSTSFFDISMPSGGIPLWSSSGVNVLVGPRYTLPNGHVLINEPIQPCGHNTSDGAYTLWDISFAGGSGSGGTQLFCTITTAAVVKNDTQITVASTTGYHAGTNYMLVATHGWPLHTTVVSVDDSTHLTLNQAPFVTDPTMPIELVQLNIKNDGCGGSCGSKLEVRFNSGFIPTNGENLDLQWLDPTGDAAIDDEGSSDYWTMRPVHIGGYRTLFYHTQANAGGVDLKPSYFEETNQLADVESETYGDELNFHRIENTALPNAFPGAYGGNVAPWYVDPEAGPTTVTYNNVRYLYNGAENGGGWANYAHQHWYLSGPPGTQYTTSGTSPAATDTAYCVPHVLGGRAQIMGLGVVADGPGTSAFVSMALYTNDPTTNRPGLLLDTTASQAISASPEFTEGSTSNDRIYSKGSYWFCSMYTWSAPPTIIGVASANAAAVTNLVGAASAEIGFPGADTPVQSLFGNTQPVGASYHATGLFAAGWPESLSGLTADIAPAHTPLPAGVWKTQ